MYCCNNVISSQSEHHYHHHYHHHYRHHQHRSEPYLNVESPLRGLHTVCRYILTVPLFGLGPGYLYLSISLLLLYPSISILLPTTKALRNTPGIYKLILNCKERNLSLFRKGSNQTFNYFAANKQDWMGKLLKAPSRRPPILQIPK